MSILLEILPLSPPTKILDWNMERGIDLLALTIPYQAVLDIKRSISLKVTKRLAARRLISTSKLV
jgi:hypothetical protein